MDKWKHLLLIALPAGFLLVFLLAQLLLPEKSLSLSERRPLASLPQASLESIESGKFMDDFEAYTLDQFPLRDAFLYYAGPCPAPQGMACGSCGPTTSARMNSFAPRLLDLGLGGMIGKGEMNEETRRALIRNQGVYFAAIGGAGALYGSAIKESRCIAFDDLLSEAVYRLEVENFPAVVAMDCHGGNIYAAPKRRG